MEEKAANSRSARQNIVMVLSLLVILVVIPAVFMSGNLFRQFLRSAGIVISPNLTGGYLIAEFNDPAGDLLLPLPMDPAYKDARQAIDLRKFSVRKVEFRPLSGVGIEPRLNLRFEFDGKQPNPFDSKNKFSIPVMHVYIKSPNVHPGKPSSDKMAHASIRDGNWNYQVIIDGMHEQARVFDTTGNLICEGLGLYVNYEEEQVRGEKQQRVTKTVITAGLPLKLIGDPARGEWTYYVAVGLLDVKHPSMMFQETDSSDVFDCVVPDTTGKPMSNSNGQLQIPPLVVQNAKL